MRAYVRTILIFACTAGLLALFLRQADFASVWQEIRRASPLDLWLALVMTALVYVVRAWRWRAMLLPLGQVRFSSAFRATVIGFAANALLPARAGEVLRPYLVARREHLSATSALATILLERLLDLVTVLLLFGFFVVSFSDVAASRADAGLYRTVEIGGVLAGFIAAAGLLLVFVAAGHPERLGRFARRAEHFLPARLAHPMAVFVERFASGFAVMRRPGPLVRALLWSLPLWLAIAAGIWFVARAFHITMSFTGTFLILTLLIVGVAVPTPGAVGGFHYAFRIGATVFFGASNEQAIGAAIVLHAISFVPVTLLGLWFMLQEGLDLGRLRHLAASASADEPPNLQASDPAEVGSPIPPARSHVDGSPAPPDDERAQA